MLASLILGLREGLEMALLIGIVLSILRKVQRPDLNRLVWLGAGTAALLSLGAALALRFIGAELEGRAEQLFEASTMLLAAGVLTWMILWMQRQARHMKGELESGLRKAMSSGGRSAVFLFALLAVLREGVELALLLTAAAFSAGGWQTAAGAALGLSGAAVLGWAIFRASFRLDLRRFFQVTGFVLILFAAGLAARGAHELIEAGLLPQLVAPLWNLNPIVQEASPLGQLLQALFGYTPTPSLMEALAYLGYFAALFLGLRWQNSPAAVKAQSSSSN